MPAPIVWAAIAGGAVLVGLASDALWGDEDAREAAQNAGIDPDTTDPADLTPEQVAALSEELAKLPPEVQEGLQSGMQAEIQQARQATGTTDLGGLAGQLAPDGQPAGPAGTTTDGSEAPEGSFTHEGHTFFKDPPTPETAAERPRDPLLARQFVSQGLTPRAEEQAGGDVFGDPADAFMTGGLPTGPGQVDEQGRLLEGLDDPHKDTYPGHTRSEQVLPYIAALHEWATAEGRSVEGLYRQRYYRQEMLRLNRELQTRTARTPNALAISPAEASLREWFEREGTLSPWEQRDPLSFTEEELTAPASSVSGLTSELPDRGDAPGGPDGEHHGRAGNRFSFAPFASIEGRDDLMGSAVDTDGVLALLSQSGDFWSDEGRLSRIDQSGRMVTPDATSVLVRREKKHYPDYENNADRVLRGLAPGGDPNIARMSAFEVGEQALIDQLHRMGKDEVERLQTELWKAGFFGQQVPTRGTPDGLTVEAFGLAIEEAARFRRAGESVTLEDVIERRQEHWADRLGELASGARGLSQQTVEVALEDPAALQELIEQQSIQTIGAANLDESQVQSFIGAIHQAQRQQAAARVQRRNQALEQWQPETPWDEPPEFGEGGIVESVNISAAARAEDFIEQQRPAEAGATQFANTYGSFLDLIGGGRR